MTAAQNRAGDHQIVERGIRARTDTHLIDFETGDLAYRHDLVGRVRLRDHRFEL